MASFALRLPLHKPLDVSTHTPHTSATDPSGSLWYLQPEKREEEEDKEGVDGSGRKSQRKFHRPIKIFAENSLLSEKCLPPVISYPLFCLERGYPLFVSFELAVASVKMSVIGKMTLRVHRLMEVTIPWGSRWNKKFFL
jgi:hypothetical protein